MSGLEGRHRRGPQELELGHLVVSAYSRKSPSAWNEGLGMKEELRR